MPEGTAAAAPPAVSGDGQPAVSPGNWIRRLVGNRPMPLIVVEKDKQELTLYRYDNGLNAVASYFAATGENQGPKRRSGDSRTPEGIYFITKIFTDSKLTVFGKRAFHLDYPNIFDQQEGHNGDGIYIHGTNRQLVPNSTNGCITMRNEDLDKLVRHLVRDQIPVIVVADMDVLEQVSNPPMPAEEQLGNLLLDEELRNETFQVDSLYLLSTGGQTVMLGTFTIYRQIYTSMTGFGRSYLRYTADQGWQAVQQLWRATPLEINPVRQKIALKGSSNGALPKARPQPVAYPRDAEAVSAFIEQWRQAWAGKQIDRYIACYLPEFVNGKRNLAGWRRYKERLNRKYRTISVSIDGLKITWQRQGAQVVFHQVYDSDIFHADGHKKLLLRYTDNQWRIYREIWLH